MNREDPRLTNHQYAPCHLLRRSSCVTRTMVLILPLELFWLAGAFIMLMAFMLAAAPE
jgi:hypothetical protein